MAVRHRISFRGDQRPWSDAGHSPPLDVVELDPARRPAPPRPDAAAPRRPPSRPGTLLLLGVAVAAAMVAVLTWARVADPEPDPRVGEPAESGAAPESEAIVAGPQFDVTSPGGPARIPADRVVSPPLRATLSRYWPSSVERDVRRVHTWFLDDLAAWAAGTPRRALLVADPTRRAQAGVAVRRLVDPKASVVTWEWDRPGWGFTLIAAGVDDRDALALIEGGVALPTGPSLEPDGPPWLDPDTSSALGFDVRWTRWVPAAVVGGPLVGQGGLDTVEGYIYAPGPHAAAGPVLVSGVRDRAVRAADLAAVAPDAVREVDGRTMVGFGYAIDAPVGFRITGASRLVFDHDEHITFELASDAVDVDGLIAMARSVDFGRLAGFLRTG